MTTFVLPYTHLHASAFVLVVFVRTCTQTSYAHVLFVLTSFSSYTHAFTHTHVLTAVRDLCFVASWCAHKSRRNVLEEMGACNQFERRGSCDSEESVELCNDERKCSSDPALKMPTTSTPTKPNSKITLEYMHNYIYNLYSVLHCTALHCIALPYTATM